MAKLTVTPKSYSEALAALGDKSSMTIGHNTRMYRWHGTVCIQLHNTDIVTFQADGPTIINSGGWRTVTTKERINKFLPAGVYLFQKDWDWFLHTPDGDVSFSDGMEV